MTVHIKAAEYIKTRTPSHSLCGKQHMPTSPLQFFSVEEHIDADCPECLKHLDRFTTKEWAALLGFDVEAQQKPKDGIEATA